MSTATTLPASAGTADTKPAKKKINWSSLPDIWALIRPRRGLLLVGLLPNVTLSRQDGSELQACNNALLSTHRRVDNPRASYQGN